MANTTEPEAKLLAILKKANKPLTATEFLKKSKMVRSSFYKHVGRAKEQGLMHQNDSREYVKGRGRKAKTAVSKAGKKAGKKQECRTCGEKKPQDNEHYSKLSPAVQKNTGNTYMPNCRVCMEQTPGLKGIVAAVKKLGMATGQKVADAYGINRATANHRMMSACGKGYLTRVSMGVYTVSEKGKQLDTRGASMVNSRNLDRQAKEKAETETHETPSIPTDTQFQRGLKLFDLVLSRGDLEDDQQVELEIARDLMTGSTTATSRATTEVLADLD
jgi:hypothetical protein